VEEIILHILSDYFQEKKYKILLVLFKDYSTKVYKKGYDDAFHKYY